jgi:Uma2 family endonuclease
VAPSSRARDTGAKLADYMRIPSLRDYLVVRTEDKTIIHHARGADGAIMTRIIRDGTVALAAGLTLTRVFDAR